ncbi:hypothetical protein GGR57DRAFT_477356 [Xylariaceae sp. FL1272]|nr:hypothetical protein GGR57DRAFT_477356 [Xylariaceae sp. FL1272]
MPAVTDAVCLASGTAVSGVSPAAADAAASPAADTIFSAATIISSAVSSVLAAVFSVLAAVSSFLATFFGYAAAIVLGTTIFGAAAFAFASSIGRVNVLGRFLLDTVGGGSVAAF